MGLFRHDAIVVTCTGIEAAQEIASEALRLGLLCSNPVSGLVNDVWTLLIAPDGSKEGWDESNQMDAARKAWIDWAGQSGWFDWVHVSYGGDYPEKTKVAGHNMENSGW